MGGGEGIVNFTGCVTKADRFSSARRRLSEGNFHIHVFFTEYFFIFLYVINRLPQWGGAGYAMPPSNKVIMEVVYYDGYDFGDLRRWINTIIAECLWRFYITNVLENSLLPAVNEAKKLVINTNLLYINWGSRRERLKM